MVTLHLTFPARVGLSNLVGIATGPLGKLISLQKVFEAVRLSEEEAAQVVVRDLGNGMSSFEPPSAEFGVKDAQIEDADADVLLREIEGNQNFRMSDLTWVEAVKKQIKRS